MLVDAQVPVCNNFGFSSPRMMGSSAPRHLKGNINSAIKFINCAMFPENKTGTCFFPLSTIKKFHAEIVFEAWLGNLSGEVKIVYLLFLENSSRKCLILLLFYLPFFDCKYRLHSLLFLLLVMAFPACTYEPVGTKHSFESLCVVSGLSV